MREARQTNRETGGRNYRDCSLGEKRQRRQRRKSNAGRGGGGVTEGGSVRGKAKK